jgi:acyl-coenzyme A thioesterase PaaI-like protein
MGLLSGIRLVQLDQEKSVSHVPYRWLNKNPFGSMYFAVQSMAAELSTAAMVFMVVREIEAEVSLIIIDSRAEFIRKAKSRVTFTCTDYNVAREAVASLTKIDDVSEVSMKTIGKDTEGNVVSVFDFRWSLKRRN